MNSIQAIDGTGSAALDVVRVLLASAAASDGAPPAEPAAPVDPAHPGTRVDLPPDSVPPSSRATLAELAADPRLGRLTGAETHMHGAPQGIASAPAALPAAPITHPSPAPAAAEAERAAALDARHTAATAASLAAIAAPAPADTPAATARMQPHAESAAMPRPGDTVVLPVSVTPLHSAAVGLQRPAHPSQPAPVSPRGRPRRKKDAGAHDDAPDTGDDEPAESADDACEALALPSDDSRGAAEPVHDAADPGYRELSTMLFSAGQHAALRELELKRRVLLIVSAESPSSVAASVRVHLMGLNAQDRGRVQAFRARWWSGGVAAWSQWRLHRDGEPAGAPRLCSRSPSPRSAALPCLLRLGPQPPSLIDPGGACLDVADVQRFKAALGSQWSLLALLCPPLPAAR